MKITTQRIGGALVAALLTAPLGIGIASAEVTPTPDDSGTVAPADEGTTPTDDSTTPTPTDESTTPTDGATTPTEESTTPADESTTPTDEGATPTDQGTMPAEEEVVPLQDPATPAEEETVVADISAIAFDIASYTDQVLWMPSGRYTASLTGLRSAGLDTALAMHYDIPVTWEYSLNGGAATTFVPVDGAIEVAGLVDGANTLVVTATYSVPSTTGGVSTFAGERLTYAKVLTITVLPMADTVTLLEEDTTIPSSTQQQGETLTYVSPAGSFTPGETVTVTLIPVSGAPVTVGTAVAAADGSLEVVYTAPTDLAVGVYYLLNEGTGGVETATVTRVTVTPAPVVAPTTPAPTAPATDAATGTTTGTTTSTSAVLAAAATTASSNGTSRLATTGADPSTGLAIGGLLTLAGAGAVIGARRLRSARATAE